MIRYNRKINVFLFFVIFFQAISSFGQFAPEKIKGGLFVENKGQWDNNVLYRSEIPSGQLYIEKNRFLFNFYDAKAVSRHTHGHKEQTVNTFHQNQRSNNEGPLVPDEKGIRAHAYEVVFLGCTPVTCTQGIGPADHSYNYFKGNDQTKWSSNARAYAQTVLKDIYPNTSLVCFGQETGFKYEFHLKAGANPSLIQMKYNGVDNVYLKNGELFIETSVTDFYEQKPFAYQEINGSKVAIACQFKLVNKTLSFVFPKGYNKKYPLVIDPQLIFSTYSGSTADNWGNSATYDDDGNTYMVGIAFDEGYEPTPGAYQIHYSGFAGYDTDLAIMKFDPVGKLLYATYLGGGNTEIPSSCIVNSKKELVLFGFTCSDGIKYPGPAYPTTTGAYDSTFNGGQITYPMTWRDIILFDPGSDLFISTLSSDGSSLISSTLIGGSLNDGITDVTNTFSKNYGDQFRGEIYCDELDDIYIITKTFSSDIVNPSIPGFNKTLNGLMDAYLCKMSGSLTTMYWDTYIGGSNEDVGYSIRVASDKSIYITGGTNSSDFPGTTAGLLSTYQGNIDGYIAHISADGNSLIQSTYLGTSDYDQGFFIQLDASENVYVLGQTLGEYPMSSNVYGQPSMGQFIHKIDPALSTSLLSTTFGNYTDSISIVPTAFLVNNCNNLLISGWGGTTNHYIQTYLKGNTNGLEVTPNALYPNTDGSDFYLMVMEKDFKSLLYATFYGGQGEDDHVDGGTSRFDKNGIIYQSVCGSCGGTSGFPVTDNAHSKTNNSYNCNNACFKYDLTTLKADFSIDTMQGCGTLTVHLTNKSDGGSSHEWDLGDGTKINGGQQITHTYNSVGDYTIKLIVTDAATCIGKDTAQKTVHIYPFPVNGLQAKDLTICEGDTAVPSLNCTPLYQYLWTPNLFVSNNLSCAPDFYPEQTQRYYLTISDPHSCTSKDSILINVLKYFKADFNPDKIISCGPTDVIFTNTSAGAISYEWDLGDGTKTSEPGPITHYYSKSGVYKIKLVGTNPNACINKDSVIKTVTIYAFPQTGLITRDTMICAYDTISSLVVCNSTYQYVWSPDHDISNTGICNPLFYPKETQKYFVTVTDPHSCQSRDSVLINVSILVGPIDWENMTPCNGKPTAKFVISNKGTFNYLWSFGDDKVSKESSPIHEFQEEGTYNISAHLYNNLCSTTEYLNIHIDDVDIPNLFTPNGDNKNDCFEVVGLYPNWRVEIYNAWSKNIFKSDSYKNEFCGDDVSSGVYYYLVCAPYGDCCKSWVHIIKDK